MNTVTLNVHKDLGYVTIGDIREAEQTLEFEARSPEHPIPGGFMFRWECVADAYNGEQQIYHHRLTYLSNSEEPIIETFYGSLKRYDVIATHYVLHDAVREG